MYSVYGDRLLTCRIAPFGNLRIKACLQLPEAYRSLPRPSSALGAKAFTLCSCSLDHYVIFGSRYSAIVVILPNINIRFLLFAFLIRSYSLFNFQCAVDELIVHLVGSSGLEPPTLRLSGARSNHLSYEPIWYGLRVPLRPFSIPLKKMVEMRRIELLTPCLQGRCSPS